MVNFSRNDYVTSIEEAASVVSQELGYKIIQSVYQRYGASCLDNLKTSVLPDVFSEIYAMEADLK